MATVSAGSLPAIGGALGEGFYAGRFVIGSAPYALVLAPRASGRRVHVSMFEPDTPVPSVLPGISVINGLANTAALALAGSELAKWAEALVIGSASDWYLPSRDELELVYRNLKPNATPNFVSGIAAGFPDRTAYPGVLHDEPERDYLGGNRNLGLNGNSVPAGAVYTATSPAQTAVAAFRSGGAEVMDDVFFWTSSAYGFGSTALWLQHFDRGHQLGAEAANRRAHARAVRRLDIV